MSEGTRKLVLAVEVGPPLMDCLDWCYRAQRSPMLEGHTGLGKSDILKQFAVAKGIGYICRDLSLMEPPDLVGMPKVDHEWTQFLPPKFLPMKGKGIFVMEEINRAPAYM